MSISLTNNYEEYQEKGRDHISKVGFVLVAGGLGERLGSSNIKISLVCESVSKMSFMDMYIAYME